MNTLLFTMAAITAISIIALVVIYLKHKNASEYAQQADERVQDLEAMVTVLQHEINARVSYDIKPMKKKTAPKQKASKDNTPAQKKRGRKPKS